ncbi:MAG: Poly-beta-1,6-N-acetyl-D-glucosamine synthase [Firmicutes bacterium ADurb.Bin373]|nr:glycosyltransferase [Bacillota bacterium]OQA10287.1 MAG: Poly-beta-1,6-N-acetyl-D-glucosamine synthase [Firmicutes bacterium ADurb.Bin373]
MLYQTDQAGVSLIIPCKNEGQNVRMTLDSLFAAAPVNRVEYIVVDDGSIDGCCNFIQGSNKYSGVKLVSSAGLGVSRARNMGAAIARGEYLIFCDAHITVPADWPDSLVKTFRLDGVDAVSPAIGSLDNPDATGYGQTWNERLQVAWLPPPPGMKTAPVPLLPGGCVAVRRDVFRQVGGFDPGFIAWGHEDVEFSLRLWLFGYSLFVAPQVKILHLFRKKHPYPVKMDHFLYNMLRLAYSHFNGERIKKVMGFIEEAGNAKRINQRVLKGGAMKQRLDCFARRKHDDDWYMGKFGVPF